MDADRVQSDVDGLVTRAQRGDRAAFSDLVRLHQDEVFTVAMRLVGDRELAADVAQDALLRAWRAVPRFRRDAKFSTWLHRITVNTALTAQRRRSRRRTEPLDVALETVASDDRSPEQAGLNVDLAARLSAALTELSPPLREAVVLKDVYDWAHPEIAAELDITVTAAKVRVHRGRKKLREAMAEEYG